MFLGSRRSDKLDCHLCHTNAEGGTSPAFTNSYEKVYVLVRVLLLWWDTVTMAAHLQFVRFSPLLLWWRTWCHGGRGDAEQVPRSSISGPTGNREGEPLGLPCAFETSKPIPNLLQQGHSSQSFQIVPLPDDQAFKHGPTIPPPPSKTWNPVL